MIESRMNTQDFAPQGLTHVPYAPGHVPFAHEAMLPLPQAPFAPCKHHLRTAVGKNCLQLVFQAGSVQKSQFSLVKP